MRRALAYAIDKAGLVKAVLRGYGQPAPTMPPPQQWGDLMSQAKVQAFYASLPQYTFSIAKAKAELKQSAFPNGFTATVPYPDAQPQLGKALLSLAQNLKPIGITLNVKQITDRPTGSTRSTRIPTPMGMQVDQLGVGLPGSGRRAALIYPSAYATANSFNTANYKNATMDALLARQQNSVSRARTRAAAIRQALTLGATDVPYIPIWYQQIAMALNSKYTVLELRHLVPVLSPGPQTSRPRKALAPARRREPRPMPLPYLVRFVPPPGGAGRRCCSRSRSSIFLLLYLAPGSPEQLLLGPREATPALGRGDPPRVPPRRAVPDAATGTG